MSTDWRTSLPVRDFLDMGISLMAVRCCRLPKPFYRVIFRLRLLNASPTSVRLLGRKWQLRDTSGDTRIIEAEQVFNQRPVLTPGAVFSFGGCHDFAQPPAGMEVRFFGTDQMHTPFISPPLVFPRQCFAPTHRGLS